MAFIMSLFSNAEMMGAASGAAGSSANVCTADHIADPNESVPCADAVDCLGSSMLNPCSQCRYRGLCDSDECAMKCFSLDMNEAPSWWGWEEFGL